MFCPNCGKEIEENAEFCKFCGTNLKNETDKKEKGNPFIMGCLIVVFVLVIIIFILPTIIGSSDNYSNNSQTTSTSTNCPSASELESAINQYKDAKIIGKIDPQLNSVYIPTVAQNQLSIDDIQTLGYLTACYSAYKKGTGLVWIDIYNYNTGKKIAEYSKSYGFKMK